VEANLYRFFSIVYLYMYYRLFIYVLPFGIVVNIFKSLIKRFTSFRVIIIICSY